jgi:site-specific recombinase XerD
MDDIRQTTIDRFRMYLEWRQFSTHTVASYTLDLRLFFAESAVPLAKVSYREVDQFVERQHQQGRAWATINRRLNALKHFAQFLAVCSRSKWSRHLTKSPILALLATAGSNAAYKIRSACSKALSCRKLRRN